MSWQIRSPISVRWLLRKYLYHYNMLKLPFLLFVAIFGNENSKSQFYVSGMEYKSMKMDLHSEILIPVPIKLEFLNK